LRSSRLAFLVLLGLLAAAAGAYGLVSRAGSGGAARVHACPPGYAGKAERARAERRERAALSTSGVQESAAEIAAERGTAGRKAPDCVLRKHPETPGELMARDRQAAGKVVAPAGAVRTGAQASAARERARIERERVAVPGNGAAWEPAGKGVLISDDERYDEVNGLGLADLNGRMNDFDFDAGRLFAAVGEGGVWVSEDKGANWRSIGDALPTQAVASVEYTTGGGGTLIALTGDDVFGGGNTYAGQGVYYSTDLGDTWTKATGEVPDGVIAFKLAVDPTDPDEVYAATGAGLFRSTDAGRSFVNVDLPTDTGVPADQPKCKGASPDVEGCFLANMVTDVVVQGPDNDATPDATGKPGQVVAAVGWRAGNKDNQSRTYPSFEESPNNGLYASDTGEPDSFQKLAAPGFTPQNQIGRIELGAATGPEQDRQYVYAIVEDAVKFNQGFEVLDIDSGGELPGVHSTTLDGIYVSDDFGGSWEKMAGPEQLRSPTTGSALSVTACAALQYCPGIQAWYNEFIEVDPTQESGGVPTRLTFGLEEVWENRFAVPQTGPQDFEVIGPYFSGDSCQFLSTGVPVCPGQGDQPAGSDTTTHPDQHAAIYLPEDDGGVTLVVGHDGGVNTQTLEADEDFSETRWGRGANQGFYTLLPYDAQIAKDGTIYAGLQDNGEMKIEPDGRQVMTFGGDGAFSAVDPNNSKVAYESTPFNDIRVTSNGGESWEDAAPPSDSGYQFINPFVLDPADAKHLLTAGNGVYEATTGPSPDWVKVYDLGTRKMPGDEAASPSGVDDTINKVSAVDVRGAFGGQSGIGGGPTGPKTADFTYSGGGDTVPGADLSTTFETPGTFTDREFTIAPTERNARADVKIEWDNARNDWDMRVLRRVGDQEEVVGESLSVGGSGNTEQVSLSSPPAGTYIIRVYNYAATGTFRGSAAFTQAVGSEVQGDGAAAYVGFCGFCDALNTRPFQNGLATNVGGDKPPKRLTGDGWHIAAARGLPNRYITSVQMDPDDPRTVYVTLGGYSRRWLPVNKLGEDTPNVGSGHVFKSTDAGETFTDISGNLPDTPANWTVVRNGRLVVATDVGVFLSETTGGGTFEVLGTDLPAAPVLTLELKPGGDGTLIAATQGRGVYRYRFTDAPAPAPQRPSTRRPGGRPGAGPVACTASRGFRSATASGTGRGIHFAFERREANPVAVDLFHVSRGRRVLSERLVARFTNRARSFTWSARRGRGGRPLGDGIYFARYRIAYGNRQRDFRRVTLRRSNGRWSRRPSFYRAESCGLLSSFKLERPVFGGSRTRVLGIAYRLSGPSRVTLEVFRGGRRVRSFLTRSRLAGRTYRHTLAARGLRPGDYRARITVRSGSARVVSTLVSRRL